MKIVIDDKIPYIEGVLEPFAEVVYLSGDRTTADVVRDADALITRTRTICSGELLEGSRVKLIATATSGFDHIDIGYCETAGISWINAPGCNAESVNQYIASALFSYAKRRNVILQGRTMGVVGVGQVGSRVARTCEILGMKVLLNDPPRERVEGSAAFVSLEAIRQQAEIISFHVPLNPEGRDNTWHMVDMDFCAGLPKRPLLVNTCRGEVFDTGALHGALHAQQLSGLILDCWENEPGIDLELLDRVDFGTPHIAGYSSDGKAKGTQTSVRAVSRFFGLGIDDWTPTGVEPPEDPVIELNGAGQSEESILAAAVLATYEIESDDNALRQDPRRFESLRGDYPVRREFDSYSIRASGVGSETTRKLELMGFNI